MVPLMARPSHVRDAVRQRLNDRGRHGWTIEDLLGDLHDARIPADYSSVFRAVVWLERKGAARRFDVGDGKARYEPAGEHHEHVRCQACGEVEVVPECVVEDAVGEIERTTGFRLAAHQLVLLGLCPECQSAPRS